MDVNPKDRNKEALYTGRQIVRQHMTEAVKQSGFDVDSAGDAWGKIIGVQVQIALDASMGSKATSAAKFLAQVAEITDEDTQKEQAGIGIFQVGSEGVRRLLELITEEQRSRPVES